MKRPFRVAGAMCLVLWIGVLLTALGCAAGRGPAGEVVVGWDVARLPETAEQSIAALANLWLPGLGTAGAALAGAIGIAVRNGAKRRSAEIRAAELAGANAGWDERERAASIQAPLASTTDSPGSGNAAVASVPVP